MEITLKNAKVTATINSLGAELTHFILNESNANYMWSGDPAFWTGRSPVLFPLIGSLNEDKILINGHYYSMGNHGFARRSEFELTESSAKRAVFRLTHNSDTLKVYPFTFVLELIYTLKDNCITIDYLVNNTGTDVLPFSLGTHPAFICPTGNTDRLEQWRLEFSHAETLERIGLNGNLIDLNDRTPWMKNSSVLPLVANDYYTGAIVFKDVRSNSIRLVSDATPERITVSWDNLPDLGIWQPADAPFICIEPWQGHGDPLGFTGDISKKPGIVLLEPGKTFEAQLSIAIE